MGRASQQREGLRFGRWKERLEFTVQPLTRSSCVILMHRPSSVTCEMKTLLSTEVSKLSVEGCCHSSSALPSWHKGSLQCVNKFSFT